MKTEQNIYKLCEMLNVFKRSYTQIFDSILLPPKTTKDKT